MLYIQYHQLNSKIISHLECFIIHSSYLEHDQQPFNFYFYFLKVVHMHEKTYKVSLLSSCGVQTNWPKNYYSDQYFLRGTKSTIFLKRNRLDLTAIRKKLIFFCNFAVQLSEKYSGKKSFCFPDSRIQTVLFCEFQIEIFETIKLSFLHPADVSLANVAVEI